MPAGRFAPSSGTFAGTAPDPSGAREALLDLVKWLRWPAWAAAVTGLGLIEASKALRFGR